MNVYDAFINRMKADVAWEAIYEEIKIATTPPAAKDKLLEQAKKEVREENGKSDEEKFLDLCVEKGVVTAKGQWYYITRDMKRIGQGKKRVFQLMKEDPSLIPVLMPLGALGAGIQVHER